MCLSNIILDSIFNTIYITLETVYKSFHELTYYNKIDLKVRIE